MTAVESSMKIPSFDEFCRIQEAEQKKAGCFSVVEAEEGANNGVSALESRVVWTAEALRRWNNLRQAAAHAAAEKKGPPTTAAKTGLTKDQLDGLQRLQKNEVTDGETHNLWGQVIRANKPLELFRQSNTGTFGAEAEVHSSLKVTELTLSLAARCPNDGLLIQLAHKLKKTLDSLRVASFLKEFPHINTMWEIFCFGRLVSKWAYLEVDTRTKARKAALQVASTYTKTSTVWRDFASKLREPNAEGPELWEHICRASKVTPVAFEETVEALQRRFSENSKKARIMTVENWKSLPELDAAGIPIGQQPNAAEVAGGGADNGGDEMPAQRETIAKAPTGRNTVPLTGSKRPRSPTLVEELGVDATSKRDVGQAEPGERTLADELGLNITPRRASGGSARKHSATPATKLAEAILADDGEDFFAPRHKKVKLELVVPQSQKLQSNSKGGNATVHPDTVRPVMKPAAVQRLATGAAAAAGGGGRNSAGGKAVVNCTSKYHEKYAAANKHASSGCPFCSTCHLMEALFNGCKRDCTWKHWPKSSKQIGTHLKNHPVACRLGVQRFERMQIQGSLDDVIELP